MAEHYTTISKKQVDILFYVKTKKRIKISKSMLDYLYALARQGRSLARDPAVEEFRKAVSHCVGILVQKKDQGTYEDYRLVEDEMNRAFRQICAIRSNKYLTQVKRDMESVS